MSHVRTALHAVFLFFYVMAQGRLRTEALGSLARKHVTLVHPSGKARSCSEALELQYFRDRRKIKAVACELAMDNSI